ncbi:hypothetical protein [Burkholderia sp. Ac-20365]|uniref:hypothetical protein n=1 Tax=Burkholderia sp. Ac-20365 TaxID=2703897 RepID=UPI00197BFA46|nr:hypothetical protein [Burkholderia sp. Ac-20365]MBN3762245.1 hypothetical protein [Burkholderia sp. Ac-20365]
MSSTKFFFFRLLLSGTLRYYFVMLTLNGDTVAEHALAQEVARILPSSGSQIGRQAS